MDLQKRETQDRGLRTLGFRNCTKGKEPAMEEEARKGGVRKVTGRHFKESSYLCHMTAK